MRLRLLQSNLQTLLSLLMRRKSEQTRLKKFLLKCLKQVFDGGEIIAGAEVAAKPKVSSEAAGKGVFADDLMKVEDIKNGKDKAINVMFGYVMKNSKGKADVGKAAQIIKEIISKL